MITKNICKHRTDVKKMYNNHYNKKLMILKTTVVIQEKCSHMYSFSSSSKPFTTILPSFNVDKNCGKELTKY